VLVALFAASIGVTGSMINCC